MTYALTIALILSIIGFLVHLDRKDTRERAERAVLLQRIQAPAAAVYEHAMQGVPSDGPSAPYTDAEIAEREEAARVIQFIEQHENGRLG